jgi:hypothetical protein
VKIGHFAVGCVLAIAAAGHALGQTIDTPSDRLPTGNWSFRAGPAQERGFPIDVYGVKTSAARRLSVEFVEVKNYGPDSIHRIRVGWALHSERAQVAQDSMIIELTAPLLPLQRYRITHPFTHLRQLVGRTTHLEGAYVLTFFAVADDRNYTAASQPGPVLEPLYIGNGDDGDDGGGRGCQRQRCTYSMHRGSYFCEEAEGSRCKVDDNGEGCYSSRCPI